MDLESLNTIAILDAQREYMDMNEEDGLNEEDALNEENEENAMREGETEMQEPEQGDTQAAGTTQATQPQGRQPRKRRLTSKVWEDFTSVGVESDGKERGQCNYCGKKLVINTRTHGTHHLSRHLDTCPEKPKAVDRPAYDHQIDRKMTSEIIIYHDLPFRYAEYEKVRARDLYLNPDCKPICRQTAVADVFRRYEIEKEKLRNVFAKHQGRVCFTSDLWVARPTTMGYLCLAASFIDDDWRLNNKVLAFCVVRCPHTGGELASTIIECLKDWGLEKKVFSFTLDNATNNDSMLRILKGQLQMMSVSGLLCDGKFMHVRCCAHILNLIVKDGLELAKNLLHDIRESVRYVKASPQRIQSFAACVERVRPRITGGAGLSLDVSTRWNSTYDMLVRALKFRAAFESMASFDTHYKTLPSAADWDRGAKICELLKPFSVITTYFSGSKYPTSNVYFTEVWRIERLLKKYAHCDDDGIRGMIQPMQAKFSKYWEDYNMILAMGAVLDPRMKIEVIEKAYEAVDPTTAVLKITSLKENLENLYKDYQARKWASSSGSSSSQTPYEIVNESPLEEEYDNDLFELERSIAAGVDNPKSHLDIYLEEPRVNRRNYPNLDVLGFWKENHHRLSDLADMARDLLTIPLTTVASESAFSIGGRILTPYRNRLLPKHVQALLCARNWLRGFAEFEGTIEEDTDGTGTGTGTGKTTSNSGAESSRSGESNMS